MKRQPLLQRCISFLCLSRFLSNKSRHKSGMKVLALLPRTRFSRTVCRTPASQGLQRFTCIDEIHCIAHTYIMLHSSIRTYIFTYIFTYLLTYLHTYLHTLIPTYMHARVHTDMQACYMHACAHTDRHS